MKAKFTMVLARVCRAQLLVAKSLVLFLLSAGLVQAAGLKALPGHVPAAVARMNLQPIGNLAGTTRLHLAIGLPLHNQETLTNLLRQLYDPASPDYRHFLTPAQFTGMFGPSDQDYQAVAAFAETNGLTITGTYSNRVLVDVSGAAANIEKAFRVKLRLYRHPTEHRNFYAPDVEPSVPATLPVLDVSGLSDYRRPHPNCVSGPLIGAQSSSTNGSGPYGLYMGSDFRTAYVPGVTLNGAGQTVALVQFDGYNASDIRQYEALANLPHVPLQNVLLDGFNGVPTGGIGTIEVSLDIEMAISMAPGVSKVILYEGNPYNFIPNDVLSRIANDDSASQISCSWGWNGGPQATTDNIFKQMAAQGQSFFTASGDSDAYPPGTVDGPANFGTPSDSPYVTSVGGTTLTMNGTAASWASEEVWNWGNRYPGQGYDGVGSSGGTSSYYPIPSWQTNVVNIDTVGLNQGSTTFRNFPDVAMTADDVFVIANNGFWYKEGGTSCASPLWAGFMALVNQQAVAGYHSPVGFINPDIYAIAGGSDYDSDFHDIDTGDNTWSGSPGIYHAVFGYDLCTGLGTPNGAGLINALAAPALNGFLTVSVNPPSGSALIASQAQPISVTVRDNFYATTNATVTGSTASTNLVFQNNQDGTYSNTLQVPALNGSFAMTIVATNAGEIGVTNVIYYQVIQPPANDNFANATKVPVTGGASYAANNRFATLEPGEPKHDGDQNDAASLWWVWTPAADTNVFIDTVGSKVDNVLAVYTGDSLDSLQSMASTNSSLALSGMPAQMSFSVQAGATYHIAVASASSRSLGSLELHITPGGQPDISPPVVAITSPQSGLSVYDNIYSIAGTASDPGANPGGISQVFVSFNGRSPVTAIGTTNWTSWVALKPNMNVIQAWAVDAAGNISATQTIQLNYLILPPANDFFADAIPLSSASSPILATNVLASKEAGEPDPVGNLGGKSLWWSFAPLANGVLTLNTSNSTFDTIMGLYTGTNVANLTTIVDNDDAYNGAPGGFSYISQAVTNGQTYYILVDGYNGVSGKISLAYFFTPATVYHLTANTFDLTATNSGGGTVQLLTTNSLGGASILPSASGDFASGTPVVLTAFPDRNHQFYAWNVDSTNNPDNPLTVAMTGNKNVTAEFAARQFTDGFESGGLGQLPWITPDPNRTNDRPWFVQSKVVDVGQYAAQSYTNLPDSQSTSLVLTTTFTNGTGSFDFKVSSEPNFDILTFSVNGTILAQWSGEVGWANYSFSLPAGTNTLEWTYAKDATISLGLDAAFLDDVVLPIGTPSSNSGPAQLQLQRQAAGGWSMNLVGQSGQPYVIQTSTDLIHWQNISTNIAIGGSIRIPLPSNPTNRTQFYRAIAP